MRTTTRLTMVLATTLAVVLCLSGGSASAGTKLKLWHGETTEIRLPGKTLENPYHSGAKTFKQVVEKETNGEYTIEIYAGTLFSGEREGIENAKMGAVDFVISASARG